MADTRPEDGRQPAVGPLAAPVAAGPPGKDLPFPAVPSASRASTPLFLLLEFQPLWHWHWPLPLFLRLAHVFSV